jgi:hypothetical protein
VPLDCHRRHNQRPTIVITALGIFGLPEQSRPKSNYEPGATLTSTRLTLGVHDKILDSRLRGNDGQAERSVTEAFLPQLLLLSPR